MSLSVLSKTLPNWLKSFISLALPAEKLVKDREGLRLKVYKDSLGKPTAGYGHLLKPDEEKLVITQALADEWFEQDIAAALLAASTQVKHFPFHTQELKDVLVSVNYQLGTGWAKKFPKTWAHLCAGEFDKAAWEAEDSLWAKQTPIRVRDFQRICWRTHVIKQAVEAM